MADDIEELANSIYLENQLDIGWRISDFDGDKKTRLSGYAVALRTFADLHPPASVPNPSGIYPTEFKVLIDPKPIEEKIGSVYLPAETVDREKYGQIKGRVVAVSPHAFTYADREAWIEAGVPKPKAGDIALYARHAGLRVKGKDGKDYLLVNDKDICATIED